MKDISILGIKWTMFLWKVYSVTCLILCKLYENLKQTFTRNCFTIICFLMQTIFLMKNMFTDSLILYSIHKKKPKTN